MNMKFIIWLISIVFIKEFLFIIFNYIYFMIFKKVENNL